MVRAREERRRQQALDAFRRREQQLRPAYKIWGYKNVFAKGFVITDGPTAFSPDERWDHRTVGRWHVRLDTTLERQSASGSGTEVLVLGHAFDDGGPKTRARVASRLLRTVAGAASVDAQTDALDEAITWLSGRYVVLVARGDRLDVWADPLASRSVYFRRDDHGVALASHTAILADLAGGLPNTRMRWALRHPDYHDGAGRWIPGLITPHDGVEQLYANARLTVQGTQVAHERFFPRASRVAATPLEACTVFRDELRQQVKNWVSVAPVTVIGLTAGRDSRAILQAGLVELQRADAAAMTYHAFRGTGKSTYLDMVAGGRQAAAAGLHHLSIDIPPMSPNSEMARLYGKTFPTWQRYANLTNALYLCSPAKAATIFGIGGAIITGMYRDTSATAPTPEILAAKYAQSRFRDDPELHAEMARWMAFTSFSNETLLGYDFHDFFHWEHRMTKWGGAGYAEYDLATTPAPVFSSRKLLVAALSLPKPQRVDALVYRFIAEGEAAITEPEPVPSDPSEPDPAAQ